MSLRSPNLASACLPLDRLMRQPPAWREKLLGVVCFSAAGQEEGILADIPSSCVRAPMLLAPTDSFCETWLTDSPLSSSHHGAVRLRQGDGLLFGCLTVDELSFMTEDGTRPGQTPLRLATEFAYRQIWEVLDTLGMPFLYRVWNYMPDINGESHGIERYRQFNIGRQDGFLAFHRALTGNVPAACALGSVTGPLKVSFLAGCNELLPIENPRQVSAYHYPQQYGPRSPTFSRANLVRIGEQEILFISGTASIIGHQSRHANNVIAQTREALTNIAAIVDEANRHATGNRFDMVQLQFKVYVRQSEDAATVRDELHRFLGCTAQALFVQADICRQELLVEIEATVGHSIKAI
jgi:chorismate lyase / 3-hydroxybenzoate synthase